MNYVQNISFPRSGHHLLVNCLRAICPDTIHYCEYYTHCHRVPCVEPKTNYQKNHDLALTLQPSDNDYYLVQYRTPLESIVSWYIHYRKRMGMLRGLVRERNTRERWENYVNQKLEYWKNFIDKWVIRSPPKNVLYIAYPDLINNPVAALKHASGFVFKDYSVEVSKIQEVVQNQQISPKSDIKNFKYYNPTRFRQWEDSIDDYLTFLKLSRVVEK